MDKITYAKKFLKDKQETKEMYQEQLFNADKKYIGKMLEQREKELSKWIDETKVEIEMATMYITDAIYKEMQGAEHDEDEAKVAELRNEANAMCEHTD
jgi:hypothetical protein